VLFVDDEETILFVVLDYFVPQAYEVDTAQDVETAAALLAEAGVCRCDNRFMLPSWEERVGFELLSRVRER
jgi:DNA-binding response OmpR family regulator